MYLQKVIFFILKKANFTLRYIWCNGNLFCLFSFFIIFNSCQKDLILNYDSNPPKQVIIANLYNNNYLRINISKSKNPDDFNAVDFLNDCKVDVYENDVFKETLPFILKDTLSGLGYYTSTFKLKGDKTYKIISTHTTLGVAEASEYLPPTPRIVNFALLQHADSIVTSKTGKYTITFQDTANFKNYYYLSTYYDAKRAVIDSLGDTTYKIDYFSMPSFTPEIPNVNNYWRSYFTDSTFDGQIKSFAVDFPSQYNSYYKEITLVIELSGVGKNFYDWNTQQLRYGSALNDGQLERVNIVGNIINGYGHFTANNSAYFTVRIK